MPTSPASTASSQIAPTVTDDPSLDAPPEPRRRPPYLAIASATVLLVLALNGVWVLWGTRPEPEPPPRIEAVLGRQIAAVIAGESETIELSDRAVRDQDLELLRNLAGLRTLIFDSGVVTDAGLRVIATLPDLNHLRLRNSPITDVGIDSLAGVESLRVLNLPQSRLSVKGVAKLAGLSRLRQLRLGGSEAAGDLSRGVAQLKHLRSVHLIDVPVSDAGLKQLASLPHLESLYLDNPSVTEAGWQWLFEHHPELHVHLNQQHHDRDPARHPHHGSEGES